MAFPQRRLRRLRRTPALRRLVAETRLGVDDLVAPLFVREGIDEPQPIASLPGQVQHTRESLRKEVTELAALGVPAVVLFGIPEHKDAEGSEAWNSDGIVQLALRDLRDDIGDRLVLIPDLCLDEYTDHGHCGLLTPDGLVDNDATLERYASMALSQARAGAHVLGLSGMMDGQVGYVREALDAAGFTDTIVLAYAAKYTSGLYGPFREAVESSLEGDRTTYQQDPANATEAVRELELDIAEGADIVMVKPATPHLDIIRAAAEMSPVPVAAYQISGEYAQIEAAAANGWIDRERAIMESLLGIRRAGAQIILTYYALEAAALLR